MIADSAVPYWPPPIAPVLPMVSTRSGASPSPRSPSSTPIANVTSAPCAAEASAMIASASARSAAAIVSPSALDPQPVLDDQHPGHGREHGRGPGPHVPQRVRRAADRRPPRERAVRPQLARGQRERHGGELRLRRRPDDRPSRIAATPSPAPRTSMSTSTSGSRRWSTTRHTSPSQRIGARNPAPAARSSRGRCGRGRDARPRARHRRRRPPRDRRAAPAPPGRTPAGAAGPPR